MVWRESSWAAHYQSPLPASDTLFTEALGPDSPGRRQQTQGSALPSSPPPLALLLLGRANSWALIGLHCLLDQPEWTLLSGYQPSHPFMLWERTFEIQSCPPAPEALGLGRGHWARVFLSKTSPALGTKGKQGDTGTVVSSLRPSHLTDSIPRPQGAKWSMTLVW